MIEIIPLDTPSLGDRSYVATDGEVAIVVDPQRDTDRVLAVTQSRGLRITHVFETHIHNDYVTGGYRLAEQVGAAYVVSADDPVRFDRTPAHDGDVFESGRMRVRVLSEGTASTLGHEAATNPALTLDEQAYVRVLLAGLDAHPAYYAHMAPANSAGPAEIDLTPPEVADAAQLRRRIEAGEWVVDLRSRTAFAAGHLPGTISLGLDGSFVTYLGWLIPWGTPVILLGETPEQVAAAQRDLVRIGIDRPADAATGTPDDWAAGEPLGALRTASFADLRTAMQADAPPVVLDVRRHDERRASHILGTVHIPLHELPNRIGEIPADATVWVHCAAGYRAAAAASLLARARRRVVLIDDAYPNAAPAGLPLHATA